MLRLILVGVMLVLGPTAALADLTYPELAHGYGKAQKETVEPLDSYLVGAYEGIQAANRASFMQNRQRLLCVPPGLELNARDLFRLIRETHEKFDQNNDIPVSYLLFIGLRQTFPCL
ncbi:MAG: hypothetical protein RQ723_06530 [Desulfuromonadales bacterium]|nr:hypothetical protein [Desulfuromonadales bacterium]